MASLVLSPSPPPVLLLRLPANALDLIQANPTTPLSIEFGPDHNQLLVDGRAIGFTAVREEQPHDVVRRDDAGEYSQVGSVVQRLTLERQLDGGVRDRVRGLGVEAERKRREHHSALLDNSSKGSSTQQQQQQQQQQQRARKRQATAPTLQPPRPRLAEIPAAPQLSLEEVRSRVIHHLALRSQNDLALRASCRTAKPSDIAAALAEVATLDASGVYALKDDVMGEVQADAWPLYTAEERIEVRLRLQRAKDEAPIKSEEEYTRAKKRFESDYARYIAVHEQLKDNQQHFERLAEQWNAAEESGARRAVAERVESDYAERAARVAHAKTEYSSLHTQLASLKSRISNYLANRPRAASS